MPTATNNGTKPINVAVVPDKLAASIADEITGNNVTATVIPIITPTNPITNSLISAIVIKSIFALRI